MKNFLNNLLRKIGYEISRFDSSRYNFRDELKTFLTKEVVGSKILDIGSAQWNYPKDHFKGITTLDLQAPADVIGSVMKMPFKDGSFDCVICLETLEHVENPLKAMEEIHRVLKSGGKFVGSTPFDYELHGEEYGDYWRFTRQGWSKILLKNFREATVRPFAGKELFPGWYFVTAIK
ncbi:MAG: class I SAM-dependent methyltransferase [Candidatus Paceibacterota bacterium]|jgi:ubiquinone/menaquinone biosynthesis C-methylase UbiE